MISEEILALSRNNAVVHAHLYMMRRDGTPYEAALERIVLALARSNEALFNDVMQCVTRHGKESHEHRP